ncbi:MAG: hypothetical protein ABSG82_04335 [Sedimentisphaerales bacterium]|jgi:hypothetical protein
MDQRAIALIGTLALTNLIACFGCAVPLAKGLGRLMGTPNRFLRYFAMFVGIYFLECVAFTWGMCTQVFTIALSFVWGALIGLWLRDIAPAPKIIRTGLFVALYGCLPTVSFAVVLLAFWAIIGNGFLNVEQAYRFGIPGFVPWPLNTMLGFCVALIVGTIILKTVLTTGITALIARGKC